ncbi:DUF4367 domain-containing protein [uncultured Dysosmobacter sp.]|uniref:DUF4367 domain-containing protein n=1 Tax=uncultured Dysosmobacter sp. TaxID=2591384 RepID=UPI00261624A4|nr:DUF4367 domain-containing protein [uncultured Dysosmobacter sp.]
MPDAGMDPVLGRAGDDSTQIQSHLNDTREQLLDELADLLFQDPDGDVDTDQLDALLEKLDEADPLPEPPDPQESLEQFHRRHADLFAAMEAESAGTPVSSPEKKRSKRKFLKFLPIAAVVVVLFGAVTAHADWGIWNIVVRITSEIFQIGGSSADYAIIRTNPLEEGEQASYDTLQEAVDAFGIDAPIVPHEIPEQFELTEVVAANEYGKILIRADYVSNDEVLQIRYKEVGNEDFSSLEIDDPDVKTYFEGGIKHYLLSDLGRQKAFWKNGELECRISGMVSEKEIKMIINSIYEGE